MLLLPSHVSTRIEGNSALSSLGKEPVVTRLVGYITLGATATSSLYSLVGKQLDLSSAQLVEGDSFGFFFRGLPMIGL